MCNCNVMLVVGSVDAYRTQRQCKLPSIQSVTPGVQRRAPEKSQPQQSVNMKEKIAVRPFFLLLLENDTFSQGVS